MKFGYIGMVIALVGVIATGAAQADNETNGPVGPKKDLDLIPGTIPQIVSKTIFSVPAKIPVVPSEVPVFEVIPHDPMKPAEFQLALQAQLGFEGVEMGVDKDAQGIAAVMHTDRAGRSVEAFRSGALFYMEEELFSERAPDMLGTLGMSQNEAFDYFASQGQDFLKSIGLQRNQMFLKDVSFMQVKSMQDRQGEEQGKVVGAAAHFGYEIGGIPAWGPGAKTTVYFGEKGVTGLYDAMRSLEPVGQVTLYRPEQAIADYIGGETPRSLLRLHTGVVEQAVVEDISLVYYMEPGNENQSMVEPHYIIQGTMYGYNPGPDPMNPREGATDAPPAPFFWLQDAADPVPEPGMVAGLAFGVIGLAGLSRRRRRQAA